MSVDAQIELMRQFVYRRLEVWPEFVAALVVGSIAHGEARPDSDVDCILVFDEMNEAIVPAEFVWRPDTDSYHTIFEETTSNLDSNQIDAKRLSLDDFLRQDWPESLKHELAHAIVLYDRHESVSDILKARVAYSESLRLSRIRNHFGWAVYYLDEWRLKGWLDKGGIHATQDQLNVAFEEIIHLLHAYNKEWMPWRYRWMVSALRLSWLPKDFRRRTLEITSRVSANEESVLRRRSELISLLDETLAQLQSEGLISGPTKAFATSHPELGYAHNFDDWREAHNKLLESKKIAWEID